MQKVEGLIDGQVQLGSRTLYRSIQRIVLDRLIEEQGEEKRIHLNDERHRIYRLTPFGDMQHSKSLRLLLCW